MNVVFGALLAALGGAVNGMFALPMKLMKKWSWENVWLPFSFLALVVFPYFTAVVGTSDLGAAYSHAQTSSICIAVVCGILAYGGSLLFGISLGIIGNSLAFSLLVGSMSTVGVLAPILVFHPGVLAEYGGKIILLGIALMFLSLFICARAGTYMAKARGTEATEPGAGKGVFLGMLLAVIGGVLSGLNPLGLSMDWAHDIATSAVTYGGASKTSAQNVVILLILLGGSLPNCLYALYLLFRNKTFSRYSGTPFYWLILLLMGVMYSGSVAMWGMSSSQSLLGALGPSIGWALFIGGLVVSSNIGGFATGEWKGAGSSATRLMVGGILVMVIAAFCIGSGNYLLK